jgi:hypothetical protein
MWLSSFIPLFYSFLLAFPSLFLEYNIFQAQQQHHHDKRMDFHSHMGWKEKPGFTMNKRKTMHK